MIDRLAPVAVCGSVVGGMLALSLLLATLPVAYVAVFAIALAVIASSAACAADLTPFEPDEIADRELATTYRALLVANTELAGALANADAAGPILARSTDAVQLCGRLARATNVVARQLGAHDPPRLEAEIARLRARSTSATDPRAAKAFAAAAEARSRQLANLRELGALRDRILGRLELTLASLEAFTAAIVKLSATDDEATIVSGAERADHGAVLADELDALEAANAAASPLEDVAR